MPGQEKVKKRINRKKLSVGPIFVGGARENAVSKAKYYRRRGFSTKIMKYKTGWRVFVY